MTECTESLMTTVGQNSQEQTNGTQRTESDPLVTSIVELANALFEDSKSCLASSICLKIHHALLHSV